MPFCYNKLMKYNPSVAIAGTLLGIVSVMHLLRVIFLVPVTIGDFDVPLLLSVLGALVTGVLSWGCLHSACAK